MIFNRLKTRWFVCFLSLE